MKDRCTSIAMSLLGAAVLLSLTSSIGAYAGVGTLADSSGEAVAWGNNTYGQSTVPDSILTTISAGGIHSLGIRTDGTLEGWGGAYSDVIAGTFRAIAAGDYHNLAIKPNGELAGWGWNLEGQINVPSGTFSAVAAGNSHSLGIRTDGTLEGWGLDADGQATVPTGTFQAVAAGDYHSLGIRSDGTLAGWGYNGVGQTTVPTGYFLAVAAGGYHSLAIATDGSVAGWGWNADGQASPPGGTFSAIAGGTFHSLGIRTDGTLAGWGDNVNGQIDVPDGIFTAVAAGDYHSLALRARTEYDDDLLVNYTGYPYGTNGLKANLNRSVNVAGDMLIESGVYLINEPTATIEGKLSLGPWGWVNVMDQATILTCGGIEVQPYALLFVPSNLTLTSKGPLMGSGTVEIQERLSVGLTDASAFTGDLHLWSNAVLTFSGTGVVTPEYVDVQYNGEVRLGVGQRFQAGWIENYGRIEALGNLNVPGGITEVECSYGGFNAYGTGLITGHDAVFRFGQGMYNDGSIALTAGLNDVFGDIENTSIGMVVVTGGSQATFYDDVVNDGLFVVRKLGGMSSTAVILGDFSGGGSTSGGGDIIFEGDLKPGNSPAAVAFDNNIALGPAATLEIEIGGLIPGGEFDVVNITGDAALGGTLTVSLIDPLGGGNVFAPSVGDTFEILTAGKLLGTFSSETFPAIPGKPSLEWFIDYDYAEDIVQLSVVPIFEADFDEDGDVDDADLARWRSGFGSGSSHDQGDADADGDVDLADLMMWQQQFGNSLALMGSRAAVPEPGMLLMGVIAIAGLWQRWSLRR